MIDMITTKEDPVVLELTAALQEWYQIWISLYLDNQVDTFAKIGTLLSTLLDSRITLIETLKENSAKEANNLKQQIAELKADIVSKLDSGNRMLGLDLIPRDQNFRPICPTELSPIRLYHLHSEAALNIPMSGSSSGAYGNHDGSTASITNGSTLSSLSYESSENVTNHTILPSYHIQANLKNHFLASLPPDELVEIHLSIIEVINNNTSVQFRPISEKFLLQIQNDEIICNDSGTIFTNIGPLVGRDVCLYIQVYRIGKMTLMDGFKTTFAKQQSGQLPQMSTQDGLTSSITATSAKYTSNGLPRSRHSTLGFPRGSVTYRRPFGATVMSLRDHLKTGSMFSEISSTIKVIATNESDFSQFQEIYAKRNLHLKPGQNLAYIQIELLTRIISGARESLAKLRSINQCCLTDKRDFPDIVMPGDFKNDLYLTLESAEFEKGGKSISKNIEASISLIDKNGIVIDDCISIGSNCDNVSSHKSCVFYHSNSPKWFESIKINVPLSEFDTAHIRIEFRHCSTKDREKRFLGFSYLPLSDEDGTVIADRSYDLYLYKCDSQSWDDESLNLCNYTNLPYGPTAKIQSNNRTISNLQNFNHSSKEIVTVSTFLLSTKLTQNSNLLNLLKWRELVKRNNDDFQDALKKVLTLKGEEIVKFLQDILDTLFETFTLYLSSEDDCSALIFKVLIHIFLLLDEPKYQHFKPVLDTYASNHFSATLVYKGLLACVKKCLEYSSMVDRHAAIQRCFKSIKYVFQFIVQSKLLYSKATGEHNDELFLNDLRHLFKLFEFMLSNSNPKVIPIQVTFLESFPGTLEQLLKVVSPHELATVVTSLAGSVGFRLPPALSRAKLIFMKETANSELIKNQDVRLQITENFCRHLDCYIKHSEELELCHAVLELLIVKIHDYHWPTIFRLYQLALKSVPKETANDFNHVMTVGEINLITNISLIQVNQLDLSLISVSKELEPFVNIMEPLLHLLDALVKDFNADRIMIQKYCTCLLTILKMMDHVSFEQFMKKRTFDYLKLCNLFRSFRAVYNRDWSIMQLTSHSILEHTIDEISKDIKTRTDSHPINRQLSSYIKLIVDFITHPTLQIETFSQRKKLYILNVFGDLRAKFSSQLMKFWADLNRATICDLIPTSIQSFLDAVLLPNSELQHKLIPVFWDMIDAEDLHKSSSRLIERCLIDNLDIFMNLDRGNSTFVENFETILKQSIKEKNPSWEQRGLKLVNSFTKLMRLILNYRESLEVCDNRSKQMCCLVELLNFYRDLERMDIYLRYLFKLCDMHLEAGNHTEAAFTLKLYADDLKWCNRNLSSLDGYRPDEQEWRRKEILYQKIIHNFDLGKCWEESIPLCKELASFYENFLVDYEKVSATLKRLAQFLDKILTQHRPEREYFKVEFLGANLPDFVMGKEFIYRGGEYERLAAFIQRMNNEFPDAQILHSKVKQSITRDSPGQYMLISNVKPVPFLQDHFKTGQRNLNDKVIHYYLYNRLDTFSYDLPMIRANSPVPKEKSGADLNVKNLWVGRYILKIRKQLPDILPWAEVISQEYLEISPINHAIETISSMNLELSKLILSYKNEPNKPISPLTMRLQGVIEAAVNGGPSVFVDAFLKRKSPTNDGPEWQPEPELSIRLRDLIKQQFSILETGLALHSKLAPPEVMPLHARLVEKLQTINII